MASGWLRRRAWFSGVAVGAAAFCVAGVASMDDWSLLKVLQNNAAVLQLEAVVPQGTSWPGFHAFVGRCHKSQFETAVGDLGMLRAAICRLALYRRSATGGDFLDFVTVRGCP